MSKKYRVDTDKGSFIIETEEPQDAILQQQAAKYPTSAEAGGVPGAAMQPSAGNILSRFGSPDDQPESMWDKTKRGLSLALNTAPGTSTGVDPASQAFISAAVPGGPATEGMGLVQALKQSPIASALSGLKNKIYPSESYIEGIRSSSSSKFNRLADALNKKPIDTAIADPLVEKAQALNQTTKSTIPAPIRGYMNFDEAPTYEQGRMWASRSGQLSQREAAMTDKAMQRVLSQFGKAMDSANRDAAASEGLGEVYDQAMKEWSVASTAAEKAAIYQKWLKRAAMTALLSGSVYKGAKAGMAGLSHEVTAQ